MKIGILKNRNRFGHIGGNSTYTHLIIENSDDVLIYNDILSKRNADANVNLWFGFKSQNFRQTISDYMVHEMPNTHTETKVLAYKLNYKDTDTSITEYCQMSDNIVSDKCSRILDHINNGKIVRINDVGGYCYIDDMSDYDVLFEPTVEQVINFIHFRTLQKEKYEINKETVIIENDKNIYNKFIEHLPFNDFNELTDFKNTIRIYTEQEIVELFVNGIKNGLKNICFETTGQDLHQIRKMCLLLDKVVELTNVKLNLYIRTYSKQVLKIFKNYNVIHIKY